MQATTKKTTVRRFGIADLPKLAALSTSLEAETAEHWAERLGHDDAIVLGAEIDGELVGDAAGEVRRSVCRTALAGWVDAFGIDLSRRGQGVDLPRQGAVSGALGQVARPMVPERDRHARADDDRGERDPHPLLGRRGRRRSGAEGQ